ncbi:MAG: YhcH/YjgK/YiaL family protein, partial [Chitinispirillaceae bacterium]|nr:YhcH/YjgK/YiaL family protein [Chitinispirillaceae bacterium]
TKLHPLFAQLPALLAGLSDLPAGTTPLFNGRGSLIVSRYDTKPIDKCIIECHNRFIDCQILLGGTERIGFGNITRCTPVSEYDHGRDFLALAGPLDFLVLRPGFFVLFFPHDAHLTQAMVDAPEPAHKVVIKIPLEET